MTVFQNPRIPRMLTRITPGRIEMSSVLLRERRKQMQYLGSQFHHYSDRAFMYSAMGGPKKGTRYVLDRHKTRAQFCHPEYLRDHYDLRSIKVAGSQYDMLGNYTRMSWDLSLCQTNVMTEPSARRQLTALNKQDAIDMMEEWGVRYVLLDEIRKPSLVDCKYHPHHIYADKFHWSPFPDTDAFMGDADFKWKRDEQIDYAAYGAHTNDARNGFTSLWQNANAATKPKTPPPSSSSSSSQQRCAEASTT